MQANLSNIIQSNVNATDAGPRYSGNGRYVAFTSSTALLPGDTNTGSDIYVRDLQKGVLTLASATNGVSLNNTASGSSISNDGQVIAYQNAGNVLVTIQVSNQSTGATVNAATSANGATANGHSYNAALSGDGRYVAFLSKATNLSGTDSNGHDDMYVKDLQTGAIRNASVTFSGVQADADSKEIALSYDGRLAAFTSYAANLVADDVSYADIFIKDLVTGGLERATTGLGGQAANGNSDHGVFSADGRYLVFASQASNLVAGDSNGTRDVFRQDLSTGVITRVSLTADGVQAAGDAGDASVSADGRYIVFSSTGNFTPGDGDGKVDVFLKDMQTGAVSRVSSAGVGDQYNYLEAGSLSADGMSLLYTNYRFQDGHAVGRDLVRVTIGDGFGSTAGQTVAGTSGADAINANQGGDRITGMGGNDAIDGGGGVDTAVYQGARANYAIATSASGAVITDNTGVDGVDTVANVERLHFANADVALDVNGSAGMAYRLYQAAFDRTPDLVGLGFWIKQLDAGVSRLDVANAFLTVPEGQALYGVNTDTGTLVTAMYNHVLHRAPDAGGYAFWVNGLEAHRTTAAEVLTYFAESVENQAALIGTIQNGMTYVPYA